MNFQILDSAIVQPLTLKEVINLKRNPSRPNMRLVSPLRFLYRGEQFCVPVGFVTDYASIPWGLWNILPPYDARYADAAIAHDWGCVTHGKFTSCNSCEEVFFNKKELDKMFLAALEAGGTSWIKRHLMYNAVRFFGPRY